MSRLKISLLAAAISILCFALFGLISISKHSEFFDVTSQPPNTTTAVNNPTITIADHTINIQLADTPQTRTQGLSGTSYLPIDSGMLFMFDDPGKYAFWMYKMNYPLDFVWINGNKVIEINENVPAPVNNASIKTVSPDFEVDKVLEINSGQIKNYGIKIGDLVKFNF
jgi:uncharacterized membrane protein (UPF0127 family)